ncbi:MAG: hypothetical protein QM831_45345 [Kofleriaceae bacterium]
MRPLIALLLFAAACGGNTANNNPGDDDDDGGLDAGSNMHPPDAGTHPDAPPDAGPTYDGTYNGPTDGNRCSEGGFCPVEPSIPLTLRGMSGTDSNDVWAVGEAGTLMHFDGTKWTRVAANTHEEFTCVKSFDRDDVWAASWGGVWHFDGTTWTKTVLTDFWYPYAISGSSSHDIWVAESEGNAHHYNGSTWTNTVVGSTSTTLYTIWSSAPNNAWAGGNGNTLFHWNGSAWSPMTSPYTGASPQYNAFVGMYGTSANNVWLSNGSELWQWNGSTWTQNGYLSSSGYVLPLWGRGANDIWSPGGDYKIDHYDGTAWQHLDMNFVTDGYIHSGITGFSPAANDVWLTTTYGGLVRGDGTTFAFTETPSRVQDRTALISTSSTNAWMFGTVTRRWDGTAWSDVSGMPATAELRAAFALSPTDIYAAGDSGSIVHYDGSTWTKIAGIPTTTWSLYAVWASAANDVYAIGYLGNLSHWDGSTWKSAWSGATTNHVYGLYGFGANDIWGAAQNGTIIHKTASGWTSVKPGTYDLYSVWGTSSTDVWVGGQFGHTFHWNGTAWSEVTTPATTDYADIRAIRGTSATDVWAMGGNGYAYHWDGTAWTRVQTGTSSTIRSLAYIGTKLTAAADYGVVIQKP